MTRINVIVTTTLTDIEAQVIAESVKVRPDMTLIEGRHVDAGKVESLLASLPPQPPCAIVLLGDPAQTGELAERWLAIRADLVVMLVDVRGDVIRIAMRDPRLDSLLAALRGFVERVGTQDERVVVMQLQPAARASEPAPGDEAEPAAETPQRDAPPIEELQSDGPPRDQQPREEPTFALLDASIEWLHHLLRDAVSRVPVEDTDTTGVFSITRATLLRALDEPAERAASDRPPDLAAADDALHAAYADACANADALTEPLAIAVTELNLTALDLRLLLLALAPEIDVRFQRCLGFLLDEMGRRVGTFGLYARLLGSSTRVRRELTESGALDRWLVLEGAGGHHAPPPADEPLHIDRALASWLLGNPDSIVAADPRLRRAMRLEPWLGEPLLTRHEERIRAEQLWHRLVAPEEWPWLVVDGEDPSGWRALFELGAAAHCVAPIRIELARLASLDLVDIEEAAIRLCRLARLSGRPIIIDTIAAEAIDGDDEWIRRFFATLAARDCPARACRAGVLCAEEARIARLLETTPFEVLGGEPLTAEARVEAVRTAAHLADVYLCTDEARAMASRYPLPIDGLEQAVHLARSRAIDFDNDNPRLARFTAALKELVAEGISHLADRLEPVFDLDAVILPPDRKSQLIEIVDNVRFAHQVLDEWKFGAQLPYGRGVTALFFGPSGTGKTMAAMGIARRLNIQILRLDLSRVVSKYIGETEKNLDRVFTDAQRTGAAILIDEADALLGKRSEVKDAHDRYANIEVAFLLQRMEAYRGLAILTTNMRQGMDPAFVRRLRFIIEFPRPDAEAREKIWRQCLPAGSHTLDDAAFRQLARKVDTTGGHIRQITLRAAFIAAAAGSLIALEHVAQAARAELAKLGLPAVDLDAGAGRRAA